jgi:hypothetical protein
MTHKQAIHTTIRPAFACDLGEAVTGETVTITGRARDDHQPPQPRGKQSQILSFCELGCILLRCEMCLSCQRE